MKRIATIVLAALASLTLVGTAAAKDCKTIAGDFVADNVFGPACTSPVGFCTHGTLTGDLRADYDFVQLTTTFQPPAALSFTGKSTITRSEGGAELYGSDAGTIDLSNGTFTTIVEIVGGTKQYDGAEGQIVATGFLTPTGTVGTYTGTICKHAD